MKPRFYPRKPAHASRSRRGAGGGGPAEAAFGTVHQVSETLHLAQAAFPQVEIAPALAHLKLTRTALTAAIHLDDPPQG